MMRIERARHRQAFHLGDDNAAVVAGRERLIEHAEHGALVLAREVAALVGRGGADDRHLRHDGRKVEPCVAIELHLAHDRLAGGRIHCAALAVRIDERIEGGRGENAGAFGPGAPMHVKKDTRRNVVCGDGIVPDHCPDRRRRSRRRAGRIGSGQCFFEQSRLRKVVDAIDAVHVSGGDGVERGETLGMAGLAKPPADRSEYRIGTAEAARRGNSDDGIVGYQAGGIAGGDDLHHGDRQTPGSILTARPVFADSSTARAPASDHTPSAPVATGSP